MRTKPKTICRWIFCRHRHNRKWEALVQYIARFNLTKILVESGPNTGYLMRKYEHWQEKVWEKMRGNSWFPADGTIRMDTIYGIDARPLVYQLYDGQDSNCIRPIVDSPYEGWDFQSDEFWSSRYEMYIMTRTIA